MIILVPVKGVFEGSGVNVVTTGGQPIVIALFEDCQIEVSISTLMKGLSDYFVLKPIVEDCHLQLIEVRGLVKIAGHHHKNVVSQNCGFEFEKVKGPLLTIFGG